MVLSPSPSLQEEGEVAMVFLGRPLPDAVDPKEVTLCSSAAQCGQGIMT